MTQLTLTCRHVDKTAALEARVRESLERLVRINDRIARCRLTVAGPERPTQAGPFEVHIELSVPGAQIHADNLQAGGSPAADLYGAVREAFDDAKRQLQSLRWDH